jgi:hypothetical protein
VDGNGIGRDRRQRVLGDRAVDGLDGDEIQEQPDAVHEHPFDVPGCVEEKKSLGWALSYGFYDAGSGKVGNLTNHDQSYVYLTPDVSSWMTVLANTVGGVANAPLCSFVLPGAHDAGTYDISNLNQIKWTSAPKAEREVIDVSVTQKDNVNTMLILGIRYFDFRPGYMKGAGPGTPVYHQHNFVPGVLYTTFLSQLAAWLSTHPGEIVVVNLNFQGFASTDMRPTPQVLQSLTQSALSEYAGMIVTGGLADLQTSYRDLVQAKKRLIFLNQIHTSDAYAATKYDTYSDAVYQTTDPQHIINRLNSVTEKKAEKFDYAVLQLQGTATGQKKNDVAAYSDASNSGSVLMSTKAQFDAQTYPWAVQNVRQKLGYNQLVVLLNDFADNALTQHAMKLSGENQPP